MVTDYYGLKRRKNVINQTIYGLIRTFEEVEMVPIIGVEPTTFALRKQANSKMSTRLSILKTNF